MKMFLIALFALSISAFAQDSNDVKFMEKINQLRRGKGLDALTYNKKLDSLAASWAKYIGDNLDKLSDKEIQEAHKKDMMWFHMDVELRMLFAKRVKGLNFVVMAENLALSSHALPEDYVDQSFALWMNSPPHYRAMINNDFTRFGYAARSYKNGRVIYITVFCD